MFFFFEEESSLLKKKVFFKIIFLLLAIAIAPITTKEDQKIFSVDDMTPTKQLILSSEPSSLI